MFISKFPKMGCERGGHHHRSFLASRARTDPEYNLHRSQMATKTALCTHKRSISSKVAINDTGEAKRQLKSINNVPCADCKPVHPGEHLTLDDSRRLRRLRHRWGRGHHLDTTSTFRTHTHTHTRKHARTNNVDTAAIRQDRRWATSSTTIIIT